MSSYSVNLNIFSWVLKPSKGLLFNYSDFDG